MRNGHSPLSRWVRSAAVAVARAMTVLLHTLQAQAREGSLRHHRRRLCGGGREGREGCRRVGTAARVATAPDVAYNVAAAPCVAHPPPLPRRLVGVLHAHQRLQQIGRELA
jgi:hypothetical protein